MGQGLTTLATLTCGIVGAAYALRMVFPCRQSWLSVPIGGRSAAAARIGTHTSRQCRVWDRYSTKDLCSLDMPAGRSMYHAVRETAVKRAKDPAYGVRPVIDTKFVLDKAAVKPTQGHDSTASEEIPKEKQFVHYHLGPFVWTTYEQMLLHIDNLAAGLAFMGLHRGDYLGFFCDTCSEWMLLLNACFAHSIVGVTVYANIGLEGISFAFQQTRLKYIFTSADLLTTVLDLHKRSPLETVIYRGTPLPGVEDMYRAEGLKLYSTDEVEKMGASHPTPQDIAVRDDIALIMFTSGTTGRPKGVMMTHGNILSAVEAATHNYNLVPNDRFLAYLPLAHIIEIVSEFVCLTAGSLIGYSTPRTLTDGFVYNCVGDINEFHPTILTAVPAVLERIRKGVVAKIHLKSMFTRILFTVALSIKTRLLGRRRRTMAALLVIKLLNKILFHKFGEIIGGNVKRIMCGGAPLSAMSHKFFECCFCCPVQIGYGLTETCGVVTLKPLQDDSFSRAGPPACISIVKLEDVPEMGYTSASKPLPCGEICVKGPQVSLGYYDLPEVTKEAYTSDGFFHTGDIGRWHEDGTLEIIDRKKNLVKLAMGEYIALEKLEATYGRSSFVDMICIYADSTKDQPVGLIVPSKTRLCEFLKIPLEKLTDTMFAEVCESPTVVKAVLHSLHKVAIDGRLTRIEKINHIRLVTDEWSPETGFLTSAMKLKRQTICTHYQKLIDDMYRSTGN
ncbi:Long-chain-fatty-acid-CoA ligase [Pelomyxa schiedti]|nr:Long-chain-fatty-acid-CoA ligase [Pelomyxa schiedti]